MGPDALRAACGGHLIRVALDGSNFDCLQLVCFDSLPEAKLRAKTEEGSEKRRICHPVAALEGDVAHEDASLPGCFASIKMHLINCSTSLSRTLLPSPFFN